MDNQAYWAGKFAQANYIMATSPENLKVRLHEALLKLDALDSSKLSEDDRQGWQELMKITSDNSKTLVIQYKTAERAAQILYALYEHSRIIDQIA